MTITKTLFKHSSGMLNSNIRDNLRKSPSWFKKAMMLFVILLSMVVTIFLFQQMIVANPYLGFPAFIPYYNVWIM